MTHVLEPMAPWQYASLQSAGHKLKWALKEAEDAKSPKLADAIRRAISSHKGAMRHAQHRLSDYPTDSQPKEEKDS